MRNRHLLSCLLAGAAATVAFAAPAQAQRPGFHARDAIPRRSGWRIDAPRADLDRRRALGESRQRPPAARIAGAAVSAALVVTAVAAHPAARHVMHYDERGTAFFALGYGRATRRPAVWITTSGTALANGFPAVVEASVDHVPMLLLTADRPPELRQTGANQTIDQVKLFVGGEVESVRDVGDERKPSGPICGRLDSDR